jgi:hypothetical protein
MVNKRWLYEPLAPRQCVTVDLFTLNLLTFLKTLQLVDQWTMYIIIDNKEQYFKDKSVKVLFSLSDYTVKYEIKKDM